MGQSIVAKNPPLDCFYVYPTVSRDSGMNSDLVVDASERGAAQVQFARFAGVCRTFAPVYRQMTLGAVAAAAAGADMKRPGLLAYSDVANAWRTYLARYNKGRPFVLIGHSQGSLMLQEIIKNEIEGKPIARQMRLRDPARIQSLRAAGPARRRDAEEHSRSALRRAKPAA